MARAGITPERAAEVGAALADELGFDAVTVAEVARRFGVKTPSLYSHVAGSADLRTRVTLLALEELADRVSERIVGRSGKEALAGLANAYRDYAHEHPGRFAATLAVVDTETAAASAGPRHAQLTAAVLRGYNLPEAAHVHAIRMLGSTVRGFITLEMSGSFDHSSPDPDSSWLVAIDALDTLMRNWPVGPSTPASSTKNGHE
ncbi:TetR family transcriptional regulator [Microbacterium sp. Root61]|uniref:TetR/AcrR family transcriptional regulator n=1 Tax=Microbacterium sp. Root61 TaxID=1736570 RepID=UPI0006F33A38|nr:TetR/AcrR family transcriptional regulator [Microbacterium sp. Root61]KRA24842.1 TetR family transcriptional regulator [Microbacterium sp. Root61]